MEVLHVHTISDVANSIALKVTVHARSNSDVGLSSPEHSSPSIGSVNVGSSTSASDKNYNQGETSSTNTSGRKDQILSEIEQQFQNWNLSDETIRVSRDTESTVPLPHASMILRHQRKDSGDTIRYHPTGRTFTEWEIMYLQYVIDRLYALIIDTALDYNSGIQYRNTFVWKFQVLLCC